MGVIDLNFRKWLRRRPCDICRKGNWNEQKGEWHNECMHITARGMGGKGQKCDDEKNCITACWKCHRISHGMTVGEFMEKKHVNLYQLAEEVWMAWVA